VRVEKSIRDEWRKIATAVWEKRALFGLPDAEEKRFFSQIERHLSISWQMTECGRIGYREAYRRNSWHLDAVRQTRHFEAGNPDGWKSSTGLLREKDSLTGREEALVGGNDFRDARKAEGRQYSRLFKHADYLGAVALIKRLWHLPWLSEEKGIPVGEYRIRSIPAIAGREETHSDDEEGLENSTKEKYIAAIAFDGDSIGRWVNGDFLGEEADLREHHVRFSENLSAFALQKVRRIVEGGGGNSPGGKWEGQLIYAGGDDVVCLVPAEDALRVVRELRVAFRRCMKNTSRAALQKKKPRPDASAGIAIAHIHSPLQDLIREAQKAEKRAKNEGPRPAFSVTLIKRSGEISHWTTQWKSGGLRLYAALDAYLAANKLRARFLHRVCQLLSPYLDRSSDLAARQDAIEDPDTAKELIEREFMHAVERQGSRPLVSPLKHLLKKHLDRISPPPSRRGEGPGVLPHLLCAVIGLCTTLAFARRNAPRATPTDLRDQSSA
jgi:CRISPR-associated protein Cmr2